MLNLYKTYKGVLNEIVQRDQIIKAIRELSVVVIYYAGDETINKGYREIEPVAFGLSTAGNMVVRAWQVRGASDTPDNIPGWRFFRVDRIVNWTQTFQKFNTPRPNYNPNGDNTMTQVFINADFAPEGIDQEMWNDI